MKIDDVDRALEDLRRLRALTPNAARSARVRARCRAAIAQRAGSAAGVENSRERVLATLVVGAVSAMYLAGIVYQAIEVFGVPRG